MHSVVISIISIKAPTCIHNIIVRQYSSIIIATYYNRDVV
jgi:hypothetical protein